MLDDRKLPSADCVVRVDRIVELCEGKSVLNIGMGGWLDSDPKNTKYLDSSALKASVHYRLSTVADRLVGTDILSFSVDSMRALVPGDYFVGDVTDPDFASDIQETFDIVVFAEVLEHVDNPRAALVNIKRLIGKNGLLLLTTVNAYSADRIVKMLFKYEANHEEHTAYYSFMTIRRLLAMTGYQMELFEFHIERPFPGSKRSRIVLYWVMRLATRILPQFSEGILITARPT